MTRNSLTKLSAPLFALFDINSKCQLSCRYCTSMPFTMGEMNPERALEVISELRRLGLMQIVFSGGEPFMHKDMIDILSLSARVGLKTSINTNGLFFAKDRNLEKYKKKLGKYTSDIALNVSIDTLDENSNDDVRGHTSLVVKGINNILDCEWPISIRSVISSKTIDNALSLVEYYYPKVKVFSFFRVIPTFQTKYNTELLISNDDFDEFCVRAERLMKKYSKLVLQLPQKKIESCDVGSYAKIIKKCFCGFSKIYIDEKFNVYPCTHSKLTENCFGNITNENFLKVWNSSKADDIRKRGMNFHLCGSSPFIQDDLVVRYQEKLF